MKEKMAKKKKRKQTLETVDAQKVNYDILHTSIWKIFQYGLVLDCIWSVLFHILNKGSWVEVLNIIMRRPGLLLLVFIVFEALYGLGFIKVSDAVLMIVIDVAVAIVVLLDFWTRGIIIICALPIVVGTILKNERLIFVQALISGVQNTV